MSDNQKVSAPKVAARVLTTTPEVIALSVAPSSPPSVVAPASPSAAAGGVPPLGVGPAVCFSSPSPP